MLDAARTSAAPLPALVLCLVVAGAVCSVLAGPAVAATETERADSPGPSATESTAEPTEERADRTESTETDSAAGTADPPTRTEPPGTEDRSGTDDAPGSDDGPTATDSREGTEASIEVAVSNLTAPDVVRVGDRVSVAATVTNPRTVAGTDVVSYRFDGRTVARERVRVPADDATTVTFEVNASAIASDGETVAPGTYVHGVANGNGSGIGERVRVTPDVDLDVGSFDAPTTVPRTEPFVVVATVANPADASVTRTVSYEVGGETVTERTVTVAGGDDQRVAFRVDAATVANATGSVTTGTTYRHAVATAGGDAEGSAVRFVEGVQANASALAVERFDAPDDVRAGEAVAANLTVVNVGDAPFEGQLSYRLGDAVVATEWTTVPIGAERTVTLRASAATLNRTVAPVTDRNARHGVWVGEESLVTRPVTVDPGLGTPTPVPSSTVVLSNGAERNGSTGTVTEPGGGECHRGFLTECGGTQFTDTTLTLIGVLTSVVGILFQLVQG